MKRATLLISLVLMFAGINIHAQTTEFTYQGQLKNSSLPANGNHDFEFALFDSLSGGSQLGSTIALTNIPVTDGSFSVQLNFGSQFPGANRFLEIHVRQSGGGAFTPLTPRQLVTSAPYSVKSLDADNAASATTAVNATQLGGVAANQYVLTGDTRLSDARNPLPNSPNYIQNQNAASQASSNFDISGTGRAGIFNAATQFNIGGSRVLSIAGTNNLFAGIGAGQANTSGTGNAFFGTGAGDSSTTGNNNAFFGQGTGQANTQGSSNSFFGETSGFLTTTGSNNSFFGGGAGLSNTTGSNNTAVGVDANVGANNLTFATAIGSGAIVGASNTLTLGRAADTVQVPGGLNVAGISTFTGTLGANIFNATSQFNIGGSRVLSIGGAENIFAGVNAGTANTSGSSNAFFGFNAGNSNIAGLQNSFFGRAAGFLNTGSNNSFFGTFAGNSNTTGSNNTIIGNSANVGNGALTFATAIGAGSTVNANSTVVLGRSADTVQVPGNLNVAGTFTASGAGGNNSVVLPNNAISAAETLDEPGVASDRGGPTIFLDGTVQTMLSQSITVPAPGFVMAIGTVRARFDHTNGADSQGVFAVSDSAGSISGNQNFNYFLTSTAPTGLYGVPITVHGLFEVASAGTFTFFLLGRENFGTVIVDSRMLTLLFVPTAYGIIFPTRPEGSSDKSDPNLKTPPDESSTGPAILLNARREENAPTLEQLRRQQAEIDALKKLVCMSHPQAEVCKEK